MSVRLRRFVIIIMAAALCAAVAPFCFAAEKNGDYKLLALTFDDGPGPYTERLLDALCEHDAKATFFTVGSNAKRYPELLARMAEDGHQLANHSYSHAYLSSLSADRITDEIESCRKYLAAAGGDDVTYYVRPPYGAYNSTVKKTVEAPLITWSVDPRDWKDRNADTVVKRVMDSVKDGDIILLHDIHPTSVDAAIVLLDKLSDEGYELVTVSELLRRRGVEAENGVVYSCARNNGVNLGPYVDPEEFDEALLSEHPAYEAICFTRFKGLFSGGEDDAFYPNKYLTRGMFVTVLGRFDGIDVSEYAVSDYSDVPAGYFCAPYAAWAKELGIMRGYGNGLFGAEDAMTREQLAACLSRYLDAREIGEPEAPDAGYSDEDEIMPWAKTGVDVCSKLGLLIGAAEGVYDPHGFTTRGQCAIVFQRLSKYVDPDGFERALAELSGKPLPEEPAVPALSEAQTEANAQTVESDEALSPRLSLSDGVVAVTGAVAAAALFITDRKERG